MPDRSSSEGPEAVVAEVAASLAGWIDRLLPDRPRAQRLRADLLETFGSDQRPLSAALVDQVAARAQVHSSHLELEYVPTGDLVPDRDPPGWPPVDAAEVAVRAASVSAVTRRPDGIGILTLDGLDDLPLAMPYLEAAFALLDQSSGLVLDLRGNGGGDPGTVALVLSWLLGSERRHFADVVRMDRVEQWWTTPRPQSRRVPPETPVTVVVGGRTYSSGEALAYFIQSSGRAAVVGQPTRGAADHITPIVLNPYLRGHLPEAYYWDPNRNGNWEGKGVLPDITAPADVALEAAVTALRSG